MSTYHATDKTDLPAIRLVMVGVFLLIFSSCASAVSRGITVAVRQSESPSAPVTQNVEIYKESYALVIGNDAYDNGWPPLGNAVKDAELISATLKERGFEVFLHRNLTSNDLNRVFKEFFILQGENPEARLFIWYAGHGATVDGEGYLIPIDAPVPSVGGAFKLASTALRDFGTYMRQSTAKHVYAVFDSCFAGTVFSTQRNAPPLAITLATTQPVRQFLTSGDADQTVSDDGAFRELFIKAIKGEERSDMNGDGYVTASELGMFLGDRLTNLTKTMQTPRYGKLRDRNYDRGDFVFKLPSTVTLVPGTTSAPADNIVVNSNAAEIEFWNSVKDSKSSNQYNAYLRTYPGGSFAKLASIRKDEAVRAERGRVAAEKSIRGVFNVRYMDEKFTATGTANVRNSPFLNASRVARLDKGDLVWVIGETGTNEQKWYRIARDGIELGFVSARLLEASAVEQLLEAKQLPVPPQTVPGPQDPVIEESPTGEYGDDPWAGLADDLEGAATQSAQAADQAALPELIQNRMAIITPPPTVVDSSVEFQQLALSERSERPSIPESPVSITETATEPLARVESESEMNPEFTRYLRAAQKGNSEAQYYLGYMYQDGVNTRIDLTQALLWYERAATANNVDAQVQLGLMYENGNGTEVDLSQAAIWYGRAAELGNADAQQLLAYFYDTGKGVAVNYEEAMRLYTEAALQGKLVAQYNLGRFYQRGLGTPVDLVKARYWYEQAASQGSDEATTKLSLLED